jgi:hypothetical protein
MGRAVIRQSAFCHQALSEGVGAPPGASTAITPVSSASTAGQREIERRQRQRLVVDRFHRRAALAEHHDRTESRIVGDGRIRTSEWRNQNPTSSLKDRTHEDLAYRARSRRNLDRGRHAVAEALINCKTAAADNSRRFSLSDLPQRRRRLPPRRSPPPPFR